MTADRHACAINQRTIVLDEAFERFPAQVQAIEVRVATLKIRHDTQCLGVVIKTPAPGKAFVKRPLAGMAERRMAEIVGERQRFGEILIQSERARERASDLRDLERVRQPRAIVIALVIDEYLRLVRQASKGSGMDDPVAVPPEGIAARTCRFIVASAPALRRIAA